MEMIEPLECLPLNNENLGLDAQNPHKKPGMALSACDPNVVGGKWQKLMNCSNLLVSQPRRSHELQAH